MTKQKRPKPVVGQTLYVEPKNPKASWRRYRAEVTHVGTKYFTLAKKYSNGGYSGDIKFNISDWYEAESPVTCVAYASNQEVFDLWEARRLSQGMREWLDNINNFEVGRQHLDALRRAHAELIGAPEA